jgi:hypothetical protein
MPDIDSPDSPLLVDEANSVAQGALSNTETHLIPPGACFYLLNADPSIDGRVQRRLGVAGAGSAGTDNPNGLFAMEAPLQNIHYLFQHLGTKLYSTTGDNVLTRAASGVSLYDTYYTGAIGRGATNTTSLFLTSCVPYTANVSIPYSNILCIDRGLSFTEIGGVRPRSLAWFQSRLWAFNSASTLAGPDYLQWSSPLDGRNFSNGQNVQIDPDSGDQGVAIVPMRDATPRMLLFKERSIHMLDVYWTTDGYYTTTGNTLDFTKSVLRPVTLETGSLATRATLWVPGANKADILFLSREGIRSLNRALDDSQAGAGLPLSFRIQPIIDRISWQYADRSVAWRWGNNAYFAVPIDGAIYNNFVIAYNTLRDAWWYLDLNVAAWSEAKLTSERKFFFLGHTTATETYAAGATNGYHIYQLESGTSNPGGSAVDFDYQTRAFSYPDPNGPPSNGLQRKKRWNWLDLGVQASTTACTLTVSYKIDEDDDWTSFTTLAVQPSDAFPYLPVQLPFTFSSQRYQHRKFDLSPLRPGYKIQFRLRDNTSYARIKIINCSLAAFPYNTLFS